MTLPRSYDTRPFPRCPKSSCDDYAKKLVEDIGQDETWGDLTVTYTCPSCGYRESGPCTPTQARKQSTTLRDQLYRLRREGVEVPLQYDTSPFPKEEW